MELKLPVSSTPSFDSPLVPAIAAEAERKTFEAVLKDGKKKVLIQVRFVSLCVVCVCCYFQGCVFLRACVLCVVAYMCVVFVPLI